MLHLVEILCLHTTPIASAPTCMVYLPPPYRQWADLATVRAMDGVAVHRIIADGPSGFALIEIAAPYGATDLAE